MTMDRPTAYSEGATSADFTRGTARERIVKGRMLAPVGGIGRTRTFTSWGARWLTTPPRLRPPSCSRA